jgi:hypothetical protein
MVRARRSRVHRAPLRQTARAARLLACRTASNHAGDRMTIQTPEALDPADDPTRDPKHTIWRPRHGDTQHVLEPDQTEITLMFAALPD